MKGGEAGKMVADARRAVARERRRARDGAMEGEDFADAVLRDGGLQGKLAGDVSRLDGIALHEDFAVTQEVVIHHAGSDHGDDDPVVADEAAAGGFGEGELVGDGAVDFRRIHGIDEPGVAFPVAPAEVVMARGGGEEEPLFDPQMPITEGKAEVDAFAPGGMPAATTCADW